MPNKTTQKNLKHGKEGQAEKSISAFIPYSHHVDDYTIKTNKSHYIQILRVPGFCAETADQIDIDSMKRIRATMLRGISDSRYAIYHHIIRREVSDYPDSDFEAGWCADLDKAYKARLNTARMFRNEQFLTIVRRPAQNPIGAIGNVVRAVFKKIDEAAAAEQEVEDIEELTDAVSMIETTLKAYGAERLKVYENGQNMLSGPLSFLSYLVNAEAHTVQLAKMPISEYLARKRISFGKESYEIRGPLPEDIKVGALLSIKDYATTTEAGMLDNLLRLPHEFTLTQSFGFLERQRSVEKMRNIKGQLKQADEGIESLIEDLEDGIDDVGSGRASIGEHHLTLNITAPNAKGLRYAITDAVKAFTDYGITVVREDINLEASFWAQLPDNFGYIARRSLITTHNFASFASLHTFPSGQMHGNHWGMPITILETTSGSPYAFSFHERDVGNFTLIGPTGAGKTVLLNFLIAQAQRVRPQTIFFDKDRGAEIFIRAIGGDYTVVEPGVSTGFNPLQLEDNEVNRAFLRQWLETLVSVGSDQTLGEDERAIISDAVSSNYELPKKKRTLRNLKTLFAGFEKKSSTSLSARFARWYGDGDKAWLFDNEVDTLSLGNKTIGFDTTSILDDEAARTPYLQYVFHRVDELLNGQKVIIMLDEGWRLLDDKAFASRIKDWEKTIRKRNGLLGFATQSVSDIFKSTVGDAIVDQSPTQIFMPNNRADAATYCDGFGLSRHELTLIKEMNPQSRLMLIRHGTDSVIARLNLNGMPDFIDVLSARTETVRICEEVRAVFGEDPEKWLPHFREAVNNPNYLNERKVS